MPAHKPRRANRTLRPAVILAILVIAGAIVVGIAASFRSESSQAAMPDPIQTPTAPLTPSPIFIPTPSPVIPKACLDMAEAAQLTYGRSRDADVATTLATDMYVRAMQEESPKKALAKLKDAKRLNAEARRLGRRTELARIDFEKKLARCKKS